jgi:hypothetical protein
MLLRSLMMQAAKRLATDPQARDRAVDLAKKARPGVEKAVRQAKEIGQSSDPARKMGRIAGRLKRRYLDDDGA